MELYKEIMIDIFTLPIWSFFWELIKTFWWIPLPFILWKKAVRFWLWWRLEGWIKNVWNPVLLEIKIPKDSVKPIRAMESVIHSIGAIVYQAPDWWEKYIEGQVQTGVSLEVVSTGGEIHFYMRFWRPYRDAVEAAIYAQYPGAEIQEVNDYTKQVPQDIPNKDWDIFAFDYRLAKPNPYPIKTYKEFETEHEAIEEKIVDPVAHLLEGLAKIKPGEHMWLQIRFSPLVQEDKWYQQTEVSNFRKEGEKIVNEIIGRKEKGFVKQKSLLAEFFDLLIFAKPPEGLKAEEEDPRENLFEMKLTPEEKKIVMGIQEKMSKPNFNCGIRMVFFGKKNVFDKSKFRLMFNFITSFESRTVNALYANGDTMTKIHQQKFLLKNLFIKRRKYLRGRRHFRMYCDRENYFFPKNTPDKGKFILNTEELASIFHFPSWRVSPVPSVSRVEVKTAPPPEVPLEE